MHRQRRLLEWSVLRRNLRERQAERGDLYRGFGLRERRVRGVGLRGQRKGGSIDRHLHEQRPVRERHVHERHVHERLWPAGWL